MVSGRVTGFQQQVLLLVARYRVMTAEALKQLVYPESPLGTARKLLGRFAEQGLLGEPYRLAGRSFYQLSLKGTALVGAPATAAKKLGAQALRDRYGMLAFAAFVDHGPLVRPQPLTAPEFATRYPKLMTQTGIDPSSQLYYVDLATGAPCLARAVVDHEAQAERLVRKCQEIFRDWEANTELKAYLPHRFMVTVLTSNPEKRQELTRRLRLLGEEFPYQVRVETIERLGDIPVEKRVS